MFTRPCTKVIIAALFLIDPNWKENQMSISGTMDEYIVVYSYRGILHRRGDKSSITTYNSMDRSHAINTILSRRSPFAPKGHALYIKFKTRQN